MNWKQINEKYPKAFLEWVNNNEAEQIKSLTPFPISKGDDDCYFVTEKGHNLWIWSKHTYQLPHYFDTLGIHIDAYFLSSSIEIIREYTGQKIDKPFAVSVHWDMAWDEDETFPDRLSALKAGVEKAFEIREEQLNKI